MEKWLVISNCQTYGLANSIQAQVSDAIVEGVDVLMFQSDRKAFSRKSKQVDKLFISREIRDILVPFGLSEEKPWIDLPMFTFKAYHPDLTYLNCNEKWVDGPTNHYHSAIVYACFKAGLNEVDTLKCFNGNFFERCGYMGLWQAERDRLVEEVSRTGVDISVPIRRWGREEAFMYSINHPKIRVLQDISTELIRLQGRVPVIGVTPHDNLASGPHFAVYPEIAESLGVAGTYVFKNAENYRSFGLKEFIQQSFAVYARLDAAKVAPHQHIDYIVSQL